ncbi:MAG: SMP-30/gluconolactonase/LRE family protein [Rhizobiaceae bacterium]|nr:SMP-30/gluconolactonase/LRE family protein [Rhizobiaceae bacterium]
MSKDWIDTLIPTAFLGVTAVALFILTPGFFAAASLSDLSRVLGEYLLVGMGVAIIMIAGGIDLSIGSAFALCNFVALALVFKFQLHVALAFPLTIAFGIGLGAINGYLVGYRRLRAFLTTLVTLVIFRSIFDLLALNYSATLLQNYQVNGIALWDFMGDGEILGLPSSFVAALLVAAGCHVYLTRLRGGWHVQAVGGSRRSAFNAGINVRRTVAATFMLGGALTAIGAFFFAARLNTAGSSTGVGMELIVITGIVLGGISLGGGRGSIAKALLGMTAVICITNGMLRMGLASGGSSMVLGAVLIVAVILDIRWAKNRHKVLARNYVAPVRFVMPPLVDSQPGAATPYAMNQGLAGVSAIGLRQLEGPEDVILDEDDHLYTGTRHGDIVRFLAPDYSRQEIVAHIGGHPLGMAIDRDGSIVACVAGMGLYRTTRDGEVTCLTNETNRSRFSIIDDSKIKMADDLDIAPDGRIFFTDPSVRYELSDWLNEALEMRGNGRLICFDPRDGSTRTVARNLIFPNGVCMTNDGQSLLLASTWACRILRYWYDGPKIGQIEVVIENLPGYPDNINRASDGTFWCALVGMRSPAFDLMLEMPKVRERMIKRVAPDNCLFANTNSGCLIRFDAEGRVLQSLWDPTGEAHSHVTSMREHKGRLFIGGLRNNRIGMIDLPEAGQDWSGYRSYWGDAR